MLDGADTLSKALPRLTQPTRDAGCVGQPATIRHKTEVEIDSSEPEGDFDLDDFYSQIAAERDVSNGPWSGVHMHGDDTERMFEDVARAWEAAQKL